MRDRQCHSKQNYTKDVLRKFRIRGMCMFSTSGSFYKWYTVTWYIKRAGRLCVQKHRRGTPPPCWNPDAYKITHIHSEKSGFVGFLHMPFNSLPKQMDTIFYSTCQPSCSTASTKGERGFFPAQQQRTCIQSALLIQLLPPRLCDVRRKEPQAITNRVTHAKTRLAEAISGFGGDVHLCDMWTGDKIAHISFPCIMSLYWTKCVK